MDWDICSVQGNRERNEDYALFKEGIGACVADGIGGAPLGDAMARCACHVALSSMEAGATPIGALRDACDYVARMIRDLRLQGSGAALTLVQLCGNHLEAAWMGDVAFCATGGNGIEASNFGSMDLCGDKVTQCVGFGRMEPHFIEADISDDARITLCTDGVWRKVGEEELARLVISSRNPQTAAAELVLGRRAEDNATALVLFPDSAKGA